MEDAVVNNDLKLVRALHTFKGIDFKHKVDDYGNVVLFTSVSWHDFTTDTTELLLQLGANSDLWTRASFSDIDGAIVDGASVAHYIQLSLGAATAAVPRHFGKKFDSSEQPRVTLGGAAITFIDRN